MTFPDKNLRIYDVFFPVGYANLIKKVDSTKSGFLNNDYKMAKPRSYFL